MDEPDPNADSRSPLRLAESRIGETQGPTVPMLAASRLPESSMSALSSPRPGARALSLAAACWFAVAALGQWAFVVYILAFNTPRVVRGDFAALNERPHIQGWVEGDTLGNAQLLIHVFIAALVTSAGLLQMLPALRRRWPAVHRWNGRVFMATALVATASGFYLSLIRGAELGGSSGGSTALNGVFILVFLVLAWRSARGRDFASHRRHAIRLWLLVNGVWFLRIGMMLAAVALAPLGVSITFGSAAFVALGFASWLLPLAVAQGYFAAERATGPMPRYAMAAVLGVLTLATAAGSLAAIAWMWWPHL